MAEKSIIKQSFFRRLFGRASPAASPAPPPYTNTSPSPKEPGIHALSVPQWTWTNEQCREWLRKFLVTQCGRSEEYAAEKAEKLEGFGVNIYLRRFKDWKELLGHIEADGVNSLVKEFRKREGVVPQGLGWGHVQ